MHGGHEPHGSSCPYDDACFWPNEKCPFRFLFAVNIIVDHILVIVCPYPQACIRVKAVAISYLEIILATGGGAKSIDVFEIIGCDMTIGCLHGLTRHIVIIGSPVGVDS